MKLVLYMWVLDHNVECFVLFFTIVKHNNVTFAILTILKFVMQWC